MAFSKKSLPKGRKTTSVRTAGFVGETTLEDMEEWIRNGAGVSEECEDVGSMPNEKFLKKGSRKRIV